VVRREYYTGESDQGFSEATQEAMKQVQGTPISFRVLGQHGEISPNPGKITKYRVTLEVKLEG
jgi:flavin-binding protein dodecin